MKANKAYPKPTEDDDEMKSSVCEAIAGYQMPLQFDNIQSDNNKLKVLSLFSGCGGMDIGFEGGFICHRKSVNPASDWIEYDINKNWVKLKPTKFSTVFANDILEEAMLSWNSYMSRTGHSSEVYHFGSIVDYVKQYNLGYDVFPKEVDIVTGGFPCQDFSVAGKRNGFNSTKDHTGKYRDNDTPTEESRGKLSFG